MTKAFNLPEKEFFTSNEIAERWGCDTSLISHYINDMRVLRPAIISKDLDLPRSKHIRGQVADRLFEADTKTDDFIELPKFLYVKPWKFVGLFGDNDDYCNSTFCDFEDFEGREYCLAEVEGLHPCDDGEIISRFHDNQPSELYITKEERDRFEKEYCSTQKEVLLDREMVLNTIDKNIQAHNKSKKVISGMEAKNTELTATINKLMAENTDCKKSQQENDLLKNIISVNEHRLQDALNQITALKVESSTLHQRLIHAEQQNAYLNQTINDKSKAPLSDRGEITYLNIIGAMLELFRNDTSYNKQSTIIRALEASHKGKQGISERGLEDKFSAANQQLKKTKEL